jgi:hypothetical protein
MVTEVAVVVVVVQWGSCRLVRMHLQQRQTQHTMQTTQTTTEPTVMAIAAVMPSDKKSAKKPGSSTMQDSVTKKQKHHTEVYFPFPRT